MGTCFLAGQGVSPGATISQLCDPKHVTEFFQTSVPLCIKWEENIYFRKLPTELNWDATCHTKYEGQHIAGTQQWPHLLYNQVWNISTAPLNRIAPKSGFSVQKWLQNLPCLMQNENSGGGGSLIQKITQPNYAKWNKSEKDEYCMTSLICRI